MADPKFDKTPSSSDSKSQDSKGQTPMQNEQRKPEQGGTDRKPEKGGSDQRSSEKSAIGGGAMAKDGQKSDQSPSPAGTDKR